MISGINHITLTVIDLEKDFLFYTEILNLKPIAKRKDKSAYLLCGDHWIVLVQDKNKQIQDSQRSYAHLALSVNQKEFNNFAEKIKKSGSEIWQQNSSPGESVYFLDRSGNKLEIHCGDWKTRLEWLKTNPSPEVTLFE